MKLKGNEIITTDDHDIFSSYYNCRKSTTERRNAVFQGVVEAGGQMENAIKHRINTAAKVKEDENAKQWQQFSIINFVFHETLKSLSPAFLYISMV